MPTSSNPKVSVIIPNYNYEQFLCDAIESLLAQTFQDFEIIIVDDASIDGSWNVCKKYHNPEHNIIAIRNERNIGTAATINVGIHNSSGVFITILSSDDMFMPNRLEVLYQASLDNPHSAIYDDMIWRSKDGDKIMRMTEYYFDDVRSKASPGLLFMCTMHAGIMYPREAWEEVSGYPEIMRDGREDWAFNIALGRAGYCGVHIKQALYIYRRHDSNRSMSSMDFDSRQRFLSVIKKLYPDIYSGSFPMGCCGGRRSNKGNKVVNRVPRNKLIAPKDNVIIEYIGTNPGTQMWDCKTGRRYKFGSVDRYRRCSVHKNDVQELMATKMFRIVEKRQSIPTPNIQATSGAVKTAKVLGIDLVDIEINGRRITKRDVENYYHKIKDL